MSSLIGSVLVVLFISSCDACMRVTPGEPGIPATPCKTCAGSLIMVTMSGAGGKPMDGDVTSTTGACSTRTFTCKGQQANLEINGGDGAIDDGGMGTATFTVTCNAAGNGWENMGITVTQIECSASGP